MIGVKVPQIGEGLREVRILNFLKKPGDWVSKDEIIYSMETDKATVEVESVHQGVLQEWLAKENSVVEIGSIICTIEGNDNLKDDHKNISKADSLQKKDIKENLRHISPRVRSYALSLGIKLDTLIAAFVKQKETVTTQDVDTYFRLPTNDKSFTKKTLSGNQIALVQALKRSQQSVVPATIVGSFDIKKLRSIQKILSTSYKDYPQVAYATQFSVFAYLVAQASKDFPKFRSFLKNDIEVTEYTYLNLGIAVHTDQNDLLTAVIKDASSLDYEAFIIEMDKQISLVRQGKGKSLDKPHVTLSYLGKNDIFIAAPILVEPSVAVLFLGASYCRGEDNGEVYLSLTFDHRLINGMEATNFIKNISRQLENITDYVPK